MTGREKKLAILTGSVVVIFATGIGVNTYIVKPMGTATAEVMALENTRGELERLDIAIRVNSRELEKFAMTTLGDDPDTVSALLGKRITELIASAGLDESRFNRLPLGSRPLRRARAAEVGWSVQGSGAMKNVIDFLYLLDSEPHTHRVESLVITPRLGSTEVGVGLRYLTLILTPPVGVKPVPREAQSSLDDVARRSYDAITQRDLFRPYVKRPPPPPEPRPAPPAPPPPPPPPPAGPGPETFRVVSLSQWKGAPEVLVHDLTKNVVTEHHAGDELAGGTVVMVDYRVLPSPRNPLIRSSSRVIIVVGGEYWAIESGDTLADRHRLRPEQFPEKFPETPRKN